MLVRGRKSQFENAINMKEGILNGKKSLVHKKLWWPNFGTFYSTQNRNNSPQSCQLDGKWETKFRNLTDQKE